MARPKVDWSRLCSEYVTASQPVTLTDLANAYGIARETVSRKATKEQWDVKRERYLMRVEEQTTEKKAQTVANEGAKWDAECLESARRLREAAMAEIANGTKSKDVAGALKIAQEMGKAALGDKPVDPPTANLNVALSIEDVVRKYAEAGSSPVPTTDSSPEPLHSS